MIQIVALPAFTDNYIWLLKETNSRRCAVVDPGDAAPVREWLEANPEFRLQDILVTHHHRDHTGGVAELRTQTGARVAGPATETIPSRDVALSEGDTLEVFGHAFAVIDVPGHTAGHIAFHVEIADQSWLFCGDTLFAGGCGRLFEGTPAQMHRSLQKLAALPDHTLVYCAHEYTLANLRFACAVEPGNAELTARMETVAAWRREDRMSVPSTLAVEKRTNPFLRTNAPEVVRSAERQAHEKLVSSESVFAALRAWKDGF